MANTPLTNTVFQGNVKSGLETGNPSTDTRAAVTLTRTVSIGVAGSANVMLPGDATNVDARLIVTTGSAGASGEVRIGNLADATHYMSWTGVSAAGIYRNPNTVSAQSLITQAGADNLMIVRSSGINNFAGYAVVSFNRGS